MSYVLQPTKQQILQTFNNVECDTTDKQTYLTSI